MQNSGINVEDYEMIASLMIEMAFDEILANELIAGRTMQEMDWAAVVGEENVPLVDQARESIRAEIVAFDDLMACGTMTAAKEKGLVRSEGKEYVMKDGDVVLFRFNV